jgi:hypothetical protein
MKRAQKDMTIVKENSNVLELLHTSDPVTSVVCTGPGLCYDWGVALNTDPDDNVITVPDVEQKGVSSPGTRGQFASITIGGNH